MQDELAEAHQTIAALRAHMEQQAAAPHNSAEHDLMLSLQAASPLHQAVTSPLPCCGVGGARAGSGLDDHMSTTVVASPLRQEVSDAKASVQQKIAELRGSIATLNADARARG